MKSVLVLLALGLLAAAAPAGAFEFLGPRSAGMGGSFVALADDASAVLVNPGGLVFQSGWNVSLQHEQSELEAEDLADLIAEARTFDPGDETVYGDEAQAEALAALLRRIKRLGRGLEEGQASVLSVLNRQGGLAVWQREWTAVVPRIDARTTAALPPGEPGSIADNPSLLALAHAEVTEYVLGYAYRTKRGGGFGMSTRYIATDVQRREIGLWEPDAGLSLASLRDLASRGPSSSGGAVSLDIGALWPTKNGRFGLVWRDALRPRIDTPLGKERVDDRLRLGYAWLPSPGFVVAADFDLMEVRDPLTETRERRLALGLEKRFGQTKIVSTRFGIARNEAAEDRRPVFAAGLGLALKHLTLDAGAWSASDREQEGLSFSLAVLF